MGTSSQRGWKAKLSHWDERISQSKFSRWWHTTRFGKALAASIFGKWLTRIGMFGFLFFLIKGLVWIAIWMGLGKLMGC